MSGPDPDALDAIKRQLRAEIETYEENRGWKESQ